MKLIYNRHRNSKSDEELLALFIEEGRVGALGELYERHIHLVFGLCLKYLKDTHQAKDAVISIYEKVQTEIDRHTIRNFKSWLYVVSKNHCLMELRKAKPGQIISLTEVEKSDSFMEYDAEMHPIDGEQTEELEKALQECIEHLKMEQQKSIRLFYFSNKCYREIADFLHTDEKKVKSYIQNAKRNLKICLDKKK
ncbi:sigma-70 family RNA polymerase sigma factor [Maribellus sp. CM-23]|uniref:RNA polymerase sigma factor n=1 Tax=Maribellus sp. CM-23 TaxID=2781026 RepID=UPI001F25A732|nr:sigma-70 family RNA polymerase sigma factor [Maribellus sp. CM-23]MCE4564567.1 sigma-70 family RNA polymerase sigma factor [Maribellus sp. CM-23]